MATLTRPQSDRPSTTRHRSWWTTPRWQRLTIAQLAVVALATIGPVVIVGTVVARLVGLIGTGDMIVVALEAGEIPGMIVFGAMFLASPVQWVTGRTQVRVRKYLGIVFFLLGASNGLMFLLESDSAGRFDEPLVVAGIVALALSLPLFLTSGRRVQRAMGLRRWRLLHRLTYPVAAALVAHVILIGDLDPGTVLIMIGFVARIPVVRRLLEQWGRRRTRSTSALVVGV